MKERCYNPKHPSYKRYGGKRISVCERWLHSFSNFLEDAGECPSGMTIDRWPNKKGNYEPGNVRWATPKQQGRNRVDNHIITWRGVTGAASEVCEHFEVNVRTVLSRLNKGWTIEAAFLTPVQVEPDYTVRGITGKLIELCRHFKVNYMTAYTRIHRKKWGPEEALTFPIRSHPKRILTVNGITGCVADLCKVFDISKGAIEYRTGKLGWGLEKAFTTPVPRHNTRAGNSPARV